MNRPLVLLYGLTGLPHIFCHLPLRHRLRLEPRSPKAINTGPVVPMAEALIVNILLYARARYGPRARVSFYVAAG
jgi:hypothetical protein